MEVLRDLGLEQDAMLYATPRHLMGHNVFCTRLAGEELGRMRSWGKRPAHARASTRSPARPTMIDLPQNFMEPILFDAACARGTRAAVAPNTSPRRTPTASRPRVTDRVTATPITIRAKYLIGADGGNSKVAEDMRACRWRARWASLAR